MYLGFRGEENFPILVQYCTWDEGGWDGRSDLFVHRVTKGLNRRVSMVSGPLKKF